MKNIAKRVAAGLVAALLLATTGCAAGGSSKQQDFQPSLDIEKEVQFNVIGYFENFEALDQVMNDFSAYYPNATFVYQRVRDNDEVAYLEANTDVDLFMSYYGQLAILPNGTANFFQMLHTLGEMGAKKAANLFQIYCLYVPL